MAVNLSIKNVPDHLAEKLRQRAVKHHRSLQGELVAILEENVASERQLTPAEFLKRIKKSGLQTPEESLTFVRKDRDARARR
jgi:plasmid stability protein